MQNFPVVIFPNEDASERRELTSGRELFFSPANAIIDQRFVGIGWQGAGVIGTDFIQNLLDLQSMLAEVRTLSVLIDFLESASGSFTAQVLDSSNGNILLVGDPLGGGLTFEYATGSIRAISSDLRSLRMALSTYGISLKRDPIFELSRVATGTACYGSDTPFHDVKVIPAGVGFQVGHDGAVSQFEYGLNSLKIKTSGYAYEELLDHGAEQVLRNVRAAQAHSTHPVYSDITGGFDSRLLLSALSAAGVRDGVVLTSLKTSAEWSYACGLAASSGFPLTDQRFLEGGPGRPSSLVERAVVGARGSGGILDNGMDPLTPESSIFTLQGGYGETFRTFSNVHLSDAAIFDVRLLACQLWAWTRLRRFEVGGTPLFSEQLTDALAGTFSRFVVSSINDGVSSDYLLNHVYANSRNRYWVGQQSYWRSEIQTRFDPLYSGFLILAAEKLPFAERRANFVGLDLMKRFESRLFEYPFYNRQVISPLWAASRGEVERRPFADVEPKQHRPVIMPASPRNRPGTSDQIRDVDRKSAQILKSSASTIAGVEKWRTFALERIQETPSVRSYFNDSALIELLSRSPATKVELETVSKLTGSLIRAGLLVDKFDSLEDDFNFGRAI